MPVTRSLTKSASSSSVAPPTRAFAPPSDSKSEPGEALFGPELPFLDEPDDGSLPHQREIRLLRDATSNAISQVWADTKAATALLSRKINEGNAALTEHLNESFSAVGRRLDSLPTIASLQSEPYSLRIPSYSGSAKDGVQFSIWLRRLEDVMNMRSLPLSNEQKAYFLIGHLEGVAREKVEDLEISARKDYSAVVNHLRSYFESSQQKHVARQQLSTCRQESGEPLASFADRVLNLVRAATAGQDPASQRERVLQEFMARLRGNIRYFVKLDNPATFELAVAKAQMVEQLLSEASADRLMHPSSGANPGIGYCPCACAPRARSSVTSPVATASPFLPVAEQRTCVVQKREPRSVCSYGP